MRTIRTKVYKFNELTPEAQNKAIENLHNLNTDYEWWDATYDDFYSMAKYFGIDVDLKKTWFTLSYSQGDGSSYTATIDVLQLINCIKSQGWKEYAPKEEFHFSKWSKNVDRVLKFIDKRVIEFTASVHPVNRETGIDLLIETDYSNTRRLDNVEKALDELEDVVKYAARALNGFLFRQLRDECDYLSGREAIIETIEANEYDFFKDGKLYDNR